jgi:hypothetical protein
MRRDEPIRQAFRWSAGRPSLRASDADREATAEVLRQAHSEGRLDTNELDERLDTCFAAKTYGDLDALVSDLPRPRSADRSSRRSYRWPLPRLVSIALLLVVVTLGWHALSLLWLLVFFMAFRFARRRCFHRGSPDYGPFV